MIEFLNVGFEDERINTAFEFVNLSERYLFLLFTADLYNENFVFNFDDFCRKAPDNGVFG